MNENTRTALQILSNRLGDLKMIAEEISHIIGRINADYIVADQDITDIIEKEFNRTSVIRLPPGEYKIIDTTPQILVMDNRTWYREKTE